MSNPASIHESLTEREVAILSCLTEGLSNQEIADRLFLAPSTVKWYVRQLNSKLATTNREEIIERAGELGLLAKPGVSLPSHDLPRATTPFIGRETELEEIYNLLSDPNVRLLTILAPGGMGKTRLALEAAEQQPANFRDGVYFVPLQAISEAAYVPYSIASAIGYPIQEDERLPGQQLLDYCREKQLLMVLDNFEHVVDAANYISELLNHAPKLKILATSRERLNLSDETPFILNGMACPDSEALDKADTYPAVMLFFQSARRVRPAFQLKNSNVQAVVQICEMVDGMPLGIVLAAAWLDMLTVQEIASEIKQSFDFLETQQRDVPQRQRSIRAVFESSWRLLSEAEQHVFKRLSVFRGGFTRQAGQAVTGASLRDLNNLINKSLLRRDEISGRYQIHELLRQYAAEQLAANPDEESRTRNAHADYYAEALHQRENDLKGGRQLEALTDIEADLENVRAAWYWNLDQLRLPQLQAMVWGMERFHAMRSYYNIGLDLFHTAVQKLEAVSDARNLYQQISTRYGNFCDVAYQEEKAIKVLEESLTLAREQNNLAEIAFTLRTLANCYADVDQTEKAVALSDESIQLYRQLGDLWGLGYALQGKSYVNSFIPIPVTLKLAAIEESLAVRRQINDKFGMAGVLNNMGIAWQELGELDRAITCLEECLVIQRELNTNRTRPHLQTLGNLAACYLNLGDFSKAEQYNLEALATLKTLNAEIESIKIYVQAAFIAAYQHNLEQQKVWMEEAHRIQKTVGSFPRWESFLTYAEMSIAYFHRDYETSQVLVEQLEQQAPSGSLEASMIFFRSLHQVRRGEQDIAKQHLLDHLDNLAQKQWRWLYPGTLYALAFASQEEAPIRAVEWASLVQHYRVTPVFIRIYVGELLIDLQGKLPVKEFAAAEARGRQLDLEATVQQILAEAASV